ncbi:hypothetical protein NZ47_10490 [Anaerovibrio lipolyticus]|uniref:Uncharacterized protein n=1 Tax=Anaerovibrio lipolyticus TaxID=82374 RepID=A0A0B2JXL1_9FIRM|nr:hypothetical protein NZ47_10490 [Anaerovibrio lipolyticus]
MSVAERNAVVVYQGQKVLVLQQLILHLLLANVRQAQMASINRAGKGLNKFFYMLGLCLT